jgi:hypothetical protein
MPSLEYTDYFMEDRFLKAFFIQHYPKLNYELNVFLTPNSISYSKKHDNVTRLSGKRSGNGRSERRRGRLNA